jgi:hypothetical protein
MSRSDFERMRMRLERQKAQFLAMRDRLSPDQVDRMLGLFDRQLERIRRIFRRPGDGSVPTLVEPPRGPKPLAGGAAAQLEFD